MVYQMVPTAETLNDLEGHSPLADVFKCNLSNICAAFDTISTDSVIAWFLCISRASCLVIKLSRNKFISFLGTAVDVIVCHAHLLISVSTSTGATTIRFRKHVLRYMFVEDVRSCKCHLKLHGCPSRTRDDADADS